MSDAKVEGAEKKCGKCNADLICVKITKEWNKKIETKLQWQTKSIKRAHFKFAGEKDGKTVFDCITPEDVIQESMEKPKEEPKPEKSMNDMKIQVDSPFSEAELIVRWASGRAYKITYESIIDLNRLTPQEKSGLGQKEGMLTRLLADVTIELMKHNGIKSEYAK
jgi:hypothetical protein